MDRCCCGVWGHQDVPRRSCTNRHCTALAADLLPPRPCAPQSVFIAGECLLALLAWAIPSWRSLELVCAAVSALFLLTLPVVPESPRWLLLRGRTQHAQRVLLWVARLNGKALKPEDLSDLFGSTEASAPAATASGRSLSAAGSAALDVGFGSGAGDSTPLLTGHVVLSTRVPPAPGPACLPAHESSSVLPTAFRLRPGEELEPLLERHAAKVAAAGVQREGQKQQQQEGQVAHGPESDGCQAVGGGVGTAGGEDGPAGQAGCAATGAAAVAAGRPGRPSSSSSSGSLQAVSLGTAEGAESGAGSEEVVCLLVHRDGGDAVKGAGAGEVAGGDGAASVTGSGGGLLQGASSRDLHGYGDANSGGGGWQAGSKDSSDEAAPTAVAAAPAGPAAAALNVERSGQGPAAAEAEASKGRSGASGHAEDGGSVLAALRHPAVRSNFLIVSTSVAGGAGQVAEQAGSGLCVPVRAYVYDRKCVGWRGGWRGMGCAWALLGAGPH